MERRIRWLGVFLVLCFIALFLQLNNIQILKAHALSTASNNPRNLELERNDPRGDILSADGVVLASSIPSSGYYRYQRTYNPFTAVLFSQIVGYDSIIYGKTGIEAEYDSYLQSHTRPAKTLGDLLTNRTTTGQRDPDHRHQAPEPGGPGGPRHRRPGGGRHRDRPQDRGDRGHVRHADVRPEPSRAARHRQGEAGLAGPRHRTAASVPSCRGSFQRGWAPGSTFKTVTSAAVYDHQPALAKVDYPVAGCISLKPQSDKPLCNYGNGAEHVRRRARPETLPAVVRHRIRPARACPSAGPRCTQEAEAFGFNQVPPIDLPGRQRVAVPGGPGIQLRSEQAVPGLLGVRSGGNVDRHRPADGSGGRRVRRPRA